LIGSEEAIVQVVYFYPWGYFYPVTSGSARVVCNHLDYFHNRGWEVDCVIACPEESRIEKLAAIRKQYAWFRSLHAIDAPRISWTFRETVLFYQEYHEAQTLCRELAASADLFFANYVFSVPLLQQLPPSCRRVLESHDILTRMFSNIAGRFGFKAANCNPSITTAKEMKHLEIEMDLYRLFDAVIMISEEELNIVRSYKLTNTYYVPQMFAPATLQQDCPAQTEFDLLFVGSENAFNRAGINWFYRNVYVPFLWKHGVRLAIVGKVSETLDLDDPLVTKMVVDELGLERAYKSSKLVIAPILEGTGTAIKTLEALAKGRIVVATPVAARGIKPVPEGIVCMDMRAEPEKTAARILELLRSASERQQLQRAAQAYMAEWFGKDRYFACMDDVLAGIGLDVQGKRTDAGGGQLPVAA
jgi:glycosyltransferase involved in cell wall biosynthesis